MPKVKYDVSGEDAERAVGGAMPLPKKGWYKARIDKVTYRKEKGDYEFQVVITDKKSKGFRLWDYINFDNEKLNWKIAQFLTAVGEVKVAKSGKKFSKSKGAFDPAETEGQNVRVRVRHDTYNDEPTAKLGGWGPPKDEDADADEEEEPEDEDEEEPDDDEEADEDEEEEEEDEGDEEDEDEDADEDEDEEDDDDADDEDDDEEEPKPKAKRKPVAKKTAKKPAKKTTKKGKGGKVKRSKDELPF